MFAETDDGDPIISDQEREITFEPNFSDDLIQPRSTGTQAAGDAIQSETSSKASDRYQLTKSNSASTTNPPLLPPQDCPQSAISEVGADSEMGVVLFNHDPSSQDVQSYINPSENKGRASQIRKRFKAANGNIMPLPLAIGPLNLPVDQLANGIVNSVISFSPLISAAIHDPVQPNVRRAGDTNYIPRFLCSVPTIDNNDIPRLSLGPQTGTGPYSIPNLAPSDGQVEHFSQNPGPQRVGSTTTTQRR